MSHPDHEMLQDDLRRFIANNVPSVPYLEALLLLRSEPERRWDAASVARRLYVDEPRAAGLLQSLADTGIVKSAGAAYSYAPETDGLRTMLDRVSAAYATDLVSVAQLIHAGTDNRARRFADAFRWKKD